MAEAHSTETQYSLSANQARASKTALCPKSANPGPNAYAIKAEGDCLAPEYKDGDTMICDPDQEPSAGDLVAIWWKDGARQPMVKRLITPLIPQSWWGLKFVDIKEPTIGFEMLNPPKRFAVPVSQLEAVHKIIHVIVA